MSTRGERERVCADICTSITYCTGIRGRFFCLTIISVGHEFVTLYCGEIRVIVDSLDRTTLQFTSGPDSLWGEFRLLEHTVVRTYVLIRFNIRSRLRFPLGKYKICMEYPACQSRTGQQRDQIWPFITCWQCQNTFIILVTLPPGAISFSRMQHRWPVTSILSEKNQASDSEKYSSIHRSEKKTLSSEQTIITATMTNVVSFNCCTFKKKSNIL